MKVRAYFIVGSDRRTLALCFRNTGILKLIIAFIERIRTTLRKARVIIPNRGIPACEKNNSVSGHPWRI